MLANQMSEKQLLAVGYLQLDVRLDLILLDYVAVTSIVHCDFSVSQYSGRVNVRKASLSAI